MFQHNLYFWLQENLSNEEKGLFRAAVKNLLAISAVERGYLGTPIASKRPIVDDSFSFSVHLTFKNTEAHDQYQVDPLHTSFVAENRAKWTRLVIYDSELST